MAQELDGVWRTVGGRRIFIANGQSLSDAMAKSGKFKSSKTKKSKSKLNQKQQSQVREVVKEMVDTLRKRDGYSDEEIREIIEDEGIMSNDALYDIEGADEKDIEKEATEYFNAYLDDKSGDTEGTTKSDYESQLSKISSIKEDGTFDLATGKVKEYQDGYQVTFSMTEMGFTDEEYSKLVDQFKQADHGTVDAGKFGGEPEISFNVTDIKKAGKLAYKYNQISIWDWKNNKEIKTGGTGKWSDYNKKKGE